MAESERPQDDTEPTEENQHADGNEGEEPDLKPPFAKGWRWPLIILVVGIIALGAFVTLVTQPEEPPAPPPPPPPPPGFVMPRV
jgi:hypothetical protein